MSTRTTRTSRHTSRTALRNRAVAQAIAEARISLSLLESASRLGDASAHIVVRKRDRHEHLGYQGGILGRYVAECIPAGLATAKPVTSFASVAEARLYVLRHIGIVLPS